MCILKSKSLDLQTPNFVWPLHTVKTSGWQVFCLEKSEQVLLPGLQPEISSLRYVRYVLQKNVSFGSRINKCFWCWC